MCEIRAAQRAIRLGRMLRRGDIGRDFVQAGKHSPVAVVLSNRWGRRVQWMCTRLSLSGFQLLCAGLDRRSWQELASRLCGNGCLFLFREVDDWFRQGAAEGVAAWINRAAGRADQLVCDAGSLDLTRVREGARPRHCFHTASQRDLFGYYIANRIVRTARVARVVLLPAGPKRVGTRREGAGL